MPQNLLVATVFEPTVAAACETIRGLSSSVDLAEVRLDRLEDLGAAPGPALKSMVREARVPLIATFRPKSKLELLAAAARAGFAWVDVELESFEAWRRAAAQSPTVKTIASWHDFESTPDDAALRAVLERLAAAGADVLKLVSTARSVGDGLRVMALNRCAAGEQKSVGAPRGRDAPEALRDSLPGSATPIAAFCMGEAGLFTRVLAGSRGAALTYGAARADAPGAPGQLDVATLLGRYRVKELGPDGRIYGVVGDPVAHSRSPALFNELFARHGMPAVYLHFRVREPDAELPALRRLGVAGLSVTIPHKAAVRAWLDREDEDVSASGACNTVVLQADGSWYGLNTDLLALRRLLAQRAGLLLGKEALVLGAGGAAAAAVRALALAGAKVTIAARRSEQSAVLAARAASRTVDWHDRDEAAEQAGLIVNCTPIGMSDGAGGENRSPLPDGCLRKGQLVIDAVYTPPETRLLAQARVAGAATVPGAAWFAEQASLQFAVWTGRTPQASVVSDILRGMMSRLS